MGGWFSQVNVVDTLYASWVKTGNIHNIPIQIIGPVASGKTSLRKALFGEEVDKNEASTTFLDLHSGTVAKDDKTKLKLSQYSLEETIKGIIKEEVSKGHSLSDIEACLPMFVTVEEFAGHSEFLGIPAIYLYVIDLSHGFTEKVNPPYPGITDPWTVKDYLEFWLKYIHLQASATGQQLKVLLVGTHHDMIEKRALDEYQTQIKRLLMGKSYASCLHNNRGILPVSNSKGTGISRLIEKILEYGDDLKAPASLIKHRDRIHSSYNNRYIYKQPDFLKTHVMTGWEANWGEEDILGALEKSGDIIRFGVGEGRRIIVHKGWLIDIVNDLRTNAGDYIWRCTEIAEHMKSVASDLWSDDGILIKKAIPEHANSDLLEAYKEFRVCFNIKVMKFDQHSEIITKELRGQDGYIFPSNMDRCDEFPDMAGPTPSLILTTGDYFMDFGATVDLFSRLATHEKWVWTRMSLNAAEFITESDRLREEAPSMVVRIEEQVFEKGTGIKITPIFTSVYGRCQVSLKKVRETIIMHMEDIIGDRRLNICLECPQSECKRVENVSCKAAVCCGHTRNDGLAWPWFSSDPWSTAIPGALDALFRKKVQSLQFIKILGDEMLRDIKLLDRIMRKSKQETKQLAEDIKAKADLYDKFQGALGFNIEHKLCSHKRMCLLDDLVRPDSTHMNFTLGMTFEMMPFILKEHKQCRPDCMLLRVEDLLPPTRP